MFQPDDIIQLGFVRCGSEDREHGAAALGAVAMLLGRQPGLPAASVDSTVDVAVNPLGTSFAGGPAEASHVRLRRWLPVLVRPMNSTCAAAEAAQRVVMAATRFLVEECGLLAPTDIDLPDRSALALLPLDGEVTAGVGALVAVVLEALAARFDEPGLAELDLTMADAAARVTLVAGGVRAELVTTHADQQEAEDRLPEPYDLFTVTDALGIDRADVGRRIEKARAESVAAAVENNDLDPVGSPRHLVLSMLSGSMAHPDGPKVRLWAGSWWLWADGVWSEATDQDVRDELASCADELFQADAAERAARAKATEDIGGAKAAPPRPIVVTQSLLANAMGVLRVMCLRKARKCDQVPEDATLPCWTGPAAESRPNAARCLVSPSGVLDLSNLASSPAGSPVPILPFSPNLFATAKVPVAYDAAAKAPTWNEFLLSIWPDDAESIQALRMWFGLLLTHETRYQKILSLIGSPGSGKGTILRVITALLGRNAVASSSLEALSRPFGMQAYLGRAVAMFPDARTTPNMDTGQAVEKLLKISGEDDVDVERKHLPVWQGKLTTRIITTSNQLLRLPDRSGALQRRYLTLSLPLTFQDSPDTHLTQRLVAELPGILNWSIEGLRDLDAAGALLQPASGRADLEGLAELNNPVGAFLADRCVLDPGVRATRASVYQAWADWCRDAGRTSVGDVISFTADLVAMRPSIQQVRLRVGGSRAQVLTGVRLRTRADRDDIEESSIDLE
jgi:putative DNA primase/helicase